MQHSPTQDSTLVDLSSMVQSTIELLLRHAPQAGHAQSRTLCEQILQQLHHCLPLAPLADLSKTLEHTVTPLFICIRGNHYKSSKQTTPSARLEERALHILATLLKRCGARVLETKPLALLEIFGRCASILGTPEGTCNGTSSDEAKQSALECCSVVLSCHQSPLWSQPESRQKVGHFISVLLSTLKMDRCKETKLNVFAVLRHVVHQSTMGTLLCFYPGMCSALCKLLLGDTLREGRKVVVEALSVLQSLILRVMSDSTHFELLHQKESEGGGKGDKGASITNNTGSSMSALQQLRGMVSTATAKRESTATTTTTTTTAPSPSSDIKRKEIDSFNDNGTMTQAWLDETGLRTSLFIDKIAVALTTGKHEHWKIRVGLLLLATSIYRECKTAAPMMIPVCMGIVVGHMYDTNEQVTRTALHASFVHVVIGQSRSR
jgi:hypothetical protein